MDLQQLYILYTKVKSIETRNDSKYYTKIQLEYDFFIFSSTYVLQKFLKQQNNISNTSQPKTYLHAWYFDTAQL